MHCSTVKGYGEWQPKLKVNKNDFLDNLVIWQDFIHNYWPMGK